MRHKKTPLMIVTIAILFLCENALSQQPLSLVTSVKLPGRALDLWMYTDTSGVEHILIGTDTAMHIFDVSNPGNPVPVSTVYISSTSGWGAFDIKVWKQYAYIVSGNAISDGLIYDLSNLANPVFAGTFPDNHNIFISPEGYLISEGIGMKIYNLNPDPLNPQIIYRSNDNDGHDAAVIGDRLFDFHGGEGTNIYSTSNMSDPQLLGFIPTTIFGYSHSGWPTEDGNYLLLSCEICPEPDLSLWDISDYNNIILKATFNDTATTTHNVQIRGSYAFVSSYEKGLRVFRISNPNNLRLVAEYDPVPGSINSFGGTFGVYAFSASGYIFTSDSREGLMVFHFDSTQVSVEQISSAVPESFQLHQNYPNPFNPETRIKFEIPLSVRSEKSEVRLSVYDVSGKEVRTLVNGELLPGVYEYSFDGTGLGSGVYFYTLKTNNYTESKRMVLVK